MSPNQEMRICNLNKGRTIKQVLYRLEIMQQYRNTRLHEVVIQRIRDARTSIKF